MKYIRVDSAHEQVGQPVFFYSELDEHRVETRKVEIFPNGNSRTTRGSEAPPELHQRFVPVEISREEFELVWNRWAR